MITPAISSLFQELAKAKLFNDIKTYVEKDLNSVAKITSTGCGSDDNFDDSSWEKFNFYVDSMNMFFAISIGNCVSDKEGIDVLFMEAKINKGNDEPTIIYVETGDMNKWFYLVSAFYRELNKYLRKVK